MDDKADKGFQIKDRRTLDAQGNPTGEQKPARNFDATKEPAKIQDSDDANQDITFASFILSLSTSAMVHLGITENPLTKKREEDLNVARQEIHILEILQEKTRGNLGEEEKRLMEDVLFHLRMVYVEKTKK